MGPVYGSGASSPSSLDPSRFAALSDQPPVVPMLWLARPLPRRRCPERPLEVLRALVAARGELANGVACGADGREDNYRLADSDEDRAGKPTRLRHQADRSVL